MLPLLFGLHLLAVAAAHVSSPHGPLRVSCLALLVNYGTPIAASPGFDCHLPSILCFNLSCNSTVPEKVLIKKSFALLWGHGHMNVFKETSLVKDWGLSFVPSMTCSRPEIPVQKLQPLYSVSSEPLLRSLCLAVLKSFTVLSDNDLMLFLNSLHTKNDVGLGATMKQRCLIVMLLIICGDVQPNPGPVDIGCKICNTPADFKNRSGLGIIHLNM